jgi:glycine/D-amino acid oxidase-like deaminating enzyme/nitrite reductase/ring-hydroxylating ferredoxin subunit
MPTTTPDTTPYWSMSASLPVFAKLDADTRADVVIVGGGITGLTAAAQLRAAGKSVVVLDRGRCGLGDTGCTTAHLTMVTDWRLHELASRVGPAHAQAVWDAGLAGIAQIDALVRQHDIDADFTWVDGYLHLPATAADADDRGLRRDAELAAELGFDAEFVTAVPTMNRAGVCFNGQARLHPRKYLAGLARALSAGGVRIFEHSAATEFSGTPLTVAANGHRITCDDVVIATHNPLTGRSGMASAALFQTKLALYTSYAVAGRLAKGVVADALYWDTATPYQYLRVEPHREHDLVILGGEDHKTGQVTDTEACYARLERALRTLLPDVDVAYRWSGQVIETPDGLPYIGATAAHQYAATGYGGNGLTFGTLAGVMVAEAILERRSPWADLFDPSRKALGRSLWDYVKENADYPYYLIRSRFAGAESRSLRAVPRGQGRVVAHKGQKAAAYRDHDGVVTVRSAICPHLGCVVAWNPAESTWDCPCHGSRFTAKGAVISGPAEAPLPEIE